MSQSHAPNNVTEQQTRRLAQWAYAFAWVGIILFAGSIIATVLTGFFDSQTFDGELIADSLSTGLAMPLTPLQRTIGFLLSIAADLPGIAGILIAMKLFERLRHSPVFTSQTANSLRQIGWCVVLLMPFSQFSHTMSTAYLTHVISPGRLNIDIEINSGDVFALVFGLVIVLLGHMMFEAANMSEENKSFI